MKLSLGFGGYWQRISAAAILAFFAQFAPAQENQNRVDSIADLGFLSTDEQEVYAVEIEAVVWYFNPINGALILNDDSGTAELKLDLSGQSVQPGDRISIRGSGTFLNLGNRFELTRIPVIDNNGLHSPEEQAGAIWLEAGKHPIRLEWFNAIGEPELSLEYESPNLERQTIPGSVLFRKASSESDGESLWQTGLQYRTYNELRWALPPSFGTNEALNNGYTQNFNLDVTAQTEFVGIEYDGYLEIAEAGEYTFYLSSDDGSRLYIGPDSLNVTRSEGELSTETKFLYPGQALQENQEYLWASVEGQVSRASKIGEVGNLSVVSGSGQMQVEIADATTLPLDSILNKRIRLTGIVQRSLSLDGIPMASTLFVQSDDQIVILEDTPASASSKQVATPLSALPDFGSSKTITPIEQIERLDKDLLKTEYTARIRGVVINPIPGGYAIVMQDAKRAMFIDLNLLKPSPIQLGELVEIEGIVDAGEFSPIIYATELKRLGTGIMPEPIKATRDEFINGSLHSQYVEIEGYVLAVDHRTVTLRTRAGVLNINLEIEAAKEWLHSVLRMRGCLRSFWDPQSREIEVGKIELNSAEISIARKSPINPFSSKTKRAAELLKFDPNASVFQRVGLIGQALHYEGTELYLVDEDHGVRVSLASETPFKRGDIVEIAGFPEFDGPSPHFAHAIARKIGHEPPPPAKPLPAVKSLDSEYDSTLVSVEGELIGMGIQEGHWTMQLRTGQNVFSAPIVPSPEKKPSYELGSQLKLTGVYLGLGGNRTLGQPIEAFEILLASIGDIQVLATPPWWTMPRLLTLVGTLCIILLVALLWIKALHRQVAVRTEELSEVLKERHRIQQEEALARERSRLAYDLHDELGAGLTEVGLLGTLATTAALPAEKREGHLARLTDKVRGLVMSLDEIVWAVNPRYDSVSSFVGYYTSYAQHFLELANVRCRFDVAEELPEEPLTSRVRHGLFLAFKESLTNVVRHAKASEVVIRIFPEGKHLVVSISDNGCGLKPDETKPKMDGLASIRDRLSQLGGHCVLESDEQSGTTISLKLPLQ